MYDDSVTITEDTRAILNPATPTRQSFSITPSAPFFSLTHTRQLPIGGGVWTPIPGRLDPHLPGPIGEPGATAGEKGFLSVNTMPGQTITTDRGTLRLVPPDLNDLRKLRQVWPFGLLRFQENDVADTGIVLQCGDEELRGMKFQPPDVPDEKTAMKLFQIHRVLIARSMAFWVQEPFAAALLPVPYLRKKGNLFESGIGGHPRSEKCWSRCDLAH